MHLDVAGVVLEDDVADIRTPKTTSMPFSFTPASSRMAASGVPPQRADTLILVFGMAEDHGAVVLANFDRDDPIVTLTGLEHSDSMILGSLFGVEKYLVDDAFASIPNDSEGQARAPYPGRLAARQTPTTSPVAGSQRDSAHLREYHG
jgi:hypothetical protein